MPLTFVSTVDDWTVTATLVYNSDHEISEVSIHCYSSELGIYAGAVYKEEINKILGEHAKDHEIIHDMFSAEPRIEDNDDGDRMSIIFTTIIDGRDLDLTVFVRSEDDDESMNAYSSEVSAAIEYAEEQLRALRYELSRAYAQIARLKKKVARLTPAMNSSD
jgi:hypothetical protein